MSSAQKKRQEMDMLNFGALKISLMSPEKIKEISFGEVKKTETLNYRTLKPERDGLFCEKIFGPVKDYECSCGKYKFASSARHKEVVCDRCGVEVTESRVRRERMGHIILDTPIAHLWYFSKPPSILGLVLDLSPLEVSNIVYCLNKWFVVKDIKESGQNIPRKTILNYNSPTDRQIIDKYAGNLADPNNILQAKVQTNAEAILSLLREMNLKLELNIIREKLLNISKDENRNKVKKLFEIYKHNANSLNEDSEEMCVIIDDLKQHLSTKKDVEGMISSFLEKLKEKNVGSEDLAKFNFTKLVDVLTNKSESLSLKGVSSLESLYEKYGLEEISDPNRGKLIRRFRLIENFIDTNTKPEWMILQVLPVLPPDLRPLVPLEGGRFASSDLNELYRRIINRNNRLKKFRTLTGTTKDAPKLILLNEKRLLQEAVDSLFENSTRKRPVMGSQKRPLKSLSDILKGKQGRFRQNLLGKRIDYSGRSVIVVGPTLKLHQCGLPKEMALELFRPFVLHRLIKKYNIPLKTAKNYFRQSSPEIWDILEEVTKHHPVLLNRAPTLHRASIQAFEPILIEGKAIQLHPLVCAAFNADFDGDQMGVYVPLTLEAQIEARLIIMSVNNLFSPANGKPLVGPTQDMVIGIYCMTQEKLNEKGEGRFFTSTDEVVCAYQHGLVNLNARIKVYGINNFSEPELKDYKDVKNWKDYSIVGRILFKKIVPEGIPVPNKALSKRDIVDIIEKIYQKYGIYATVDFLDKAKNLGYHYATMCGMTISIDDMLIPEDKNKFIEKSREKVKEIENQAKQGLITESERYNSIIDVWTETTDIITKKMVEKMKEQDSKPLTPGQPRFNSVYSMSMSGARGNIDQVKQLAAMRGLMSRPQKKISGQIGEIIETPVVSNFREGLTILEYFISTHGGRKGLADTALKTADAGYLTRRLVDVAHHVVISEEDCGTIKGIKVSSLKVGDEVIEPLEERIYGKVVLNDIVIDKEDEKTGEITHHSIVRSGEVITKEQAKEIVKSGIESIRIRSVLTCESKEGICAKCYGIDLAKGELIKVGESVGVIAAQSIGEPGTQLTLRTFHIGGAAARVVKQPKIVAPFDGILEHINFKVVHKKEDGKNVLIVITTNAAIRIVNENTKQRQSWELPYGTRVYLENETKVKKGDLIAEWDSYSIPIVAEKSGTIQYVDLIEGKTLITEHRRAGGGIEEKRVLPYKGKVNPRLNIVNDKKKILSTYALPVDAIILSEDEEEVKSGDIIAKIPREEIKTIDITGGLTRVVELFEARHPIHS
ncbi:MAG: DNA-directed RNA polymerase subunit beta', partial [Endomicrobiia bacterium]